MHRCSGTGAEGGRGELGERLLVDEHVGAVALADGAQQLGAASILRRYTGDGGSGRGRSRASEVGSPAESGVVVPPLGGRRCGHVSSSRS